MYNVHNYVHAHIDKPYGMVFDLHEWFLIDICQLHFVRKFGKYCTHVKSTAIVTGPVIVHLSFTIVIGKHNTSLDW